MKHKNKSEFAGQEVELRKDFRHEQYPEMESITIEDWWDRVSGKSWMDSIGNPTVMIYAMRAVLANYPVPLPYDDEVLYGKYSGRGVLVHISEIKKETNQ